MLYLVGGIVLVVAAAVGFPVGRTLRSRKRRDYWIANVTAAVLAVAGAATGLALGIPSLNAACIGMGFGLLTGMKWGLGAIVRLLVDERRG